MVVSGRKPRRGLITFVNVGWRLIVANFDNLRGRKKIWLTRVVDALLILAIGTVLHLLTASIKCPAKSCKQILTTMKNMGKYPVYFGARMKAEN